VRRGCVATRLVRHPRIGERSHSGRYSRLYAGLDSRLNSLLHLLLPLLQFLQELLRRLDLLLSILLLLLVVGCRLVIRLVSLVGLIIGRVISASIGRVIRRVVLILGVLTFDSNDVSTRSCHWRCHWPVIDGLVVGGRLLSRLLRSAIDSSATRLGHQNHPVQSIGISRRPQQHVIKVRSVEQRGENITSRSRTELSHDTLRRITRQLDGRTCLSPNRFQDVAQGGILGGNCQLAALERNLRRSCRQLCQRWRRTCRRRLSVLRDGLASGGVSFLAKTRQSQSQTGETHDEDRLWPQCSTCNGNARTGWSCGNS